MLRLLPHERRQAFAYRGMIRKARKRSKAGSAPTPRPQRGREIDRAHKHAVAQLFCIATYLRHGVEMRGVHVAHLRYSNASAGARNPGLQRKPDDCWTLPLSPAEHRLQHAMGEAAYWRELGCDPHSLARALYAVSSDVAAMEATLRAERPGSQPPSAGGRQ